jgi:hypothetical protein
MAQRSPESDLAAEPTGHPSPESKQEARHTGSEDDRGLKMISAAATPKGERDQGDSKVPPSSLWLPVRRTRTPRDPPATVRQHTFGTTRQARR